MAKGFILSKLLGTIQKMINGVPSFISDFDVRESSATVKGDAFISERQLVSDSIKDVNGNPLTLNISIAATNALQVSPIKDAISACDMALSQATWGAVEKKNESVIDTGIQYLLGSDAVTEKDVWSKNAVDGSLLNPEITDKTTSIPTDGYWREITNALTFDLKCECPGFTPGTIGGKNFKDLIYFISIFPARCGAITPEQVTINTFEANPTYLIMPILMLIQNYLKDYLDSTSEAIYGKQPKDNSEADDIEDQLADQLIDNETGRVGAMESTRINVKLKKITASSDIELLGIQTESNPGQALDVVDDILANPDFTDLITETPQSYEICVDDDGYDINPCDELIVHSEENLKQLFIQAIQFSRNLHMIHWLAIGNDMEKLHIKAEELYGELDQEIDLLAELIVEKTGTIVDINKIETWNTVGTQDKTFQQGIECIKQDAQSFIDYIDITYPNQPSDVQSILDDWLRYWNKQINYFIVREQED